MEKNYRHVWNVNAIKFGNRAASDAADYRTLRPPRDQENAVLMVPFHTGTIIKEQPEPII